MELQTEFRAWWKFPFKPVRVGEEMLSKLSPGQYDLESKYDGFRVIPRTDPYGTRLWTREKQPIDATDNLTPQLAALNLKSGTVLDGEIWTPTKRGSWRHDKTVQCLITLWDVIRVGSKDLSKTPLEDRRRILQDLIGDNCPDIKVIESIEMTKENYDKIKEEANAFRDKTGSRSGFIHGVVIKRKKSPRRDHSTRSTEHPDWLKIVFPNMDSGSIKSILG